MSITKIYDVLCDICSSAWVSGGYTVRYARRTAKYAGWIYCKVNGKMCDVCPECEKELENE